MRIEELNGEGKAKAERWHEDSTIDYKFPSLGGNPLFPIQRQAVQDGRIIGALAGKVELEIYLWLDPEYGTPEERWAAVQMFHNDLVQRARIIGFDSIYCVLPPEVAKSFGPRLKQLGWSETRPWPKFSFDLRPPL